MHVDLIRPSDRRITFFSWDQIPVMIFIMEVNEMETKDIILELRTKKGLYQDELAGKMMVTRQAVSRWKNGV